ncbi:hypothetical protein TK5_25270 [Sideroxyarcus sp. TK5]
MLGCMTARGKVAVSGRVAVVLTNIRVAVRRNQFAELIVLHLDKVYGSHLTKTFM